MLFASSAAFIVRGPLARAPSTGYDRAPATRPGRLSRSGPKPSRGAVRQMSWAKRFITSNVGLKVLMAVTGMLLVAFVIGHMLGNLQIFLGAEALDGYAELLRTSMELLWAVRLTLLAAVLIHIYAATVLTLRSWDARPVPYEQKTWLGESYAVRTMKWGGVILFLFIIYHLLHLTVGVQGISPEGFEHCTAAGGGELRCHAYANVVAGFQHWYVVLFYVVAQVMLGFHLAHGAWSMFRTLGLNNPRYDRIARGFALTVGTVVSVVNCIIPLSVLIGIVK